MRSSVSKNRAERGFFSQKIGRKSYVLDQSEKICGVSREILKF